MFSNSARKQWEKGQAKLLLSNCKLYFMLIKTATQLLLVSWMLASFACYYVGKKKKLHARSDDLVKTCMVSYIFWKYPMYNAHPAFYPENFGEGKRALYTSKYGNHKKFIATATMIFTFIQFQDF